MSEVLSYEQTRLIHRPAAIDISKIIKESIGIRPSGISDGVDSISFIFTQTLSDEEKGVINEIMERWSFELL